MFLAPVLTTHHEESMSQLGRVSAKSSEEETAKVKCLVLVNTLLQPASLKMQLLDMGLELLKEVDRWRWVLLVLEITRLKVIQQRIQLQEDYLFQEGQIQLQLEDETHLVQEPIIQWWSINFNRLDMALVLEQKSQSLIEIMSLLQVLVLTIQMAARFYSNLLSIKSAQNKEDHWAHRTTILAQETTNTEQPSEAQSTQW